MWVLYLNMLLALGLAVFIVWWTMGGKLKRRPPRDATPVAPANDALRRAAGETPPGAAGHDARNGADDDPRTGGGAPR
jgi:hypothetical protein